MSNLPPKEFMPKHIGIIMDGNGRWARERGLPRTEGHVQGAKVFKQIMDYGHDIGLEAMTFYAFSTENWKRPKDEIKALMQIFHEYLTEADETKYEREKRGFYLRVIGDVSGLPMTLQLLAKSACLAMNNKDAMVVNMALNYGGRQEIVHAVQQIAEKVKKGELDPKDISEDDISAGMYTAGLPDPDLIIRPSGELRLSNFLTWQSAYSEFWFDDIAWPDFTPDDLDRAIMDYAKRDRRFGGLSEQDH
ncbi:MAG: polyprenyl diphosphate synthase [Acutalibacteraceae bacterium]|nr:di-trans,poly-cis-decaprenylcistransferase [Clostridia bacterium]MDO4406042.1 polyprenyl diphosphate synthase [Eubacteriales bacterium]MDO5453338.1 polyprenyl diphosphate synthase [Eubacteriales bacterium]MEE1188797.1 polyprenyl diphosphate synthase [Acutalibacteraceae bacterium]MEE3312350.1 polyprenyl diphosphate synthase [Acutalibacteraceae bacterium]